MVEFLLKYLFLSKYMSKHRDYDCMRYKGILKDYVKNSDHMIKMNRFLVYTDFCQDLSESSCLKNVEFC